MFQQSAILRKCLRLCVIVLAAAWLNILHVIAQTGELTQPVVFPELTGPYEVGRTTYHLVDDSRDNIYLPDDVDGPREFMIWIHYPADIPVETATPAPYLPA